MAVTYDENVIRTFAERLYRRAASLVISYGLFGALVGALVGFGIATAARMPSNSTNGVAVVIGLIGAVIGGAIGSERAFALRLLAQQALCQLQIERNTRGTATGSSVPMAGMPPSMPPPMPTGSW